MKRKRLAIAKHIFIPSYCILYSTLYFAISTLNMIGIDQSVFFFIIIFVNFFLFLCFSFWSAQFGLIKLVLAASSMLNSNNIGEKKKEEEEEETLYSQFITYWMQCLILYSCIWCTIYILFSSPFNRFPVFLFLFSFIRSMMICR